MHGFIDWGYSIRFVYSPVHLYCLYVLDFLVFEDEQTLGRIE